MIFMAFQKVKLYKLTQFDLGLDSLAEILIAENVRELVNVIPRIYELLIELCMLDPPKRKRISFSAL